MFVLKSLGFRKLRHSSELQNDALMHREDVKGFELGSGIAKASSIPSRHTTLYQGWFNVGPES